MNSFQKKQVLRAQEAPEKLTEWEYDFIESIADREGELSEKQNQILNRIAEKVG